MILSKTIIASIDAIAHKHGILSVRKRANHVSVPPDATIESLTAQMHEAAFRYYFDAPDERDQEDFAGDLSEASTQLYMLERRKTKGKE